MRYIALTKDEIETLEALKKNSPDNTVRERSQCILLSHQKRTIIDLSLIFDVNRRTIERWFDSWSKNGIASLSIASGRGVKTKLKGYENEVFQQAELHSRNLKNVLTYFKDQHKIILCKKTLQNFLKGAKLQMEKSSLIIKRETKPD
jgi:transposase